MIEIKKDGLIWKCLSDNQQCKIELYGNVDSVCTLFWKVVLNLLGNFLLILSAIGLIGIFAVMIIPSIVDALFYFTGFDMFQIPSDLVASSFLGNYIIGIAMLLHILCINVKRGAEKAKRFKMNNLFVEYVKAKKDKVCPTVKFVSNKNG